MTQTQTATISNGQAISSPVTMQAGFRPVALVLPSSFDGTKITFQVSVDGSTWSNLRLAFGQSQELDTEAAAGAAVRIEWFPTWPKAFRIRSGTAASATNQTADRALTVVFEN